MRSSSSVVTPGRIASRVFSCISATTLPARRIFASSSALRLTPPPRSGRARRSRRWLCPPRTLRGGSPVQSPLVDRPHHALEHVVGVAHAVDGHEVVALEVPGDERRRLRLV